MNINDAFPSKWLRASDLQGKKMRVTISDVSVEEIGSDRKPVLYFEGKEKGLVLNKTNAQVLASAFSPETDGWVGQDILLYPAKVPFQNQMVDALRIELPVTISELDIPF